MHRAFFMQAAHVLLIVLFKQSLIYIWCALYSCTQTMMEGKMRLLTIFWGIFPHDITRALKPTCSVATEDWCSTS